MKKVFLLVLALVMVFHLFTVYPVVAEGETTDTMSLGQLDAVDQIEFDRYPDKIPIEIIPQEQIDRMGHTRRLPQAEGDMQTVMVGNDDGTNSLYIFSYPVKYTDSEGRIRDKSNRLSAHEVSEYAYINTENDIQTHLPDDITQDPVVLTYGDYAIYSIPVTDMTVSAVQSVGDDTVVYPAAFGIGADLRYQVDFSGYKEDIIIGSENAPTEYSFFMYCVGLEPMIQDGAIAYADSDSGEIVFATSPFYIYDSAVQPNSYTDTDFTLVEMENSIYKLTVDVDENFLNKENLTYPIYIDPTLSFSSSSYVDTATVYKNSPNKASTGGVYGYVGCADSIDGEARMLIRFTDLRDNFIFRNLSAEQIDSVDLYMYACAYGTSSGNVWAYQFTGNENWMTNSSWTSAEAASCGTAQSSYYLTSTTTGYVSFDITKAAKTWIGYSDDANTKVNAGIVLRNAFATSSAYCRSFYTENAGPATTPYVVVNYTPVIANGTYFIVNQETNHSLQSAGTTDGSGVKANTYYGNTSCQWAFTMQSNGYYKIRSVATGLYLSINNNDTSGTGQVTLSASSTGRGTQWAIVPTDDGGYILMANPVSITNEGAITNVLSLPSNSSSGGTVGQYAYVDDTNEKDEWYIGFTTRLEPQETDVWCWAASARMVSLNYKISVVSQASAAVYGKLEIEELDPTASQISAATGMARINVTASTLEYILGIDYVHYAYEEIYDEDTLRGLLDASTPVIIRRGQYSNYGERTGGHCVVVYDYYWDSSSSQYMFNIFDPWEVGVGDEYTLTYQQLCKRQVPYSQYYYIWDGIVVVAEGDYLNTIDWVGT